MQRRKHLFSVRQKMPKEKKTYFFVIPLNSKSTYHIYKDHLQPNAEKPILLAYIPLSLTPKVRTDSAQETFVVLEREVSVSNISLNIAGHFSQHIF